MVHGDGSGDRRQRNQVAPVIVQVRKSKGLTSSAVVSLKEALNRQYQRQAGWTRRLGVEGGRKGRVKPNAQHPRSQGAM